MDFSFGKLDTVPVAGTESYLKAYNIYNEVSIKSIRKIKRIIDEIKEIINL